MKNDAITVSEFNSILNQTLNFAYPEVVVQGEIASFKINQGKWVFFDLKDDNSVVSCFMPIFQLKTQLEDGMMIRVKSIPQLTKWGKFSLTVREIELAGEGSVKRAFELLKSQLQKEGLFDDSRKRQLPEFPNSVLLITSRQAAAFSDFTAIINDRWNGINIDHVQVQVQGENAPSQIIDAIEYANSNQAHYQVVILIRGGGSAEDLQAFNTEQVVRSVFGSKVPIVVGVGHEDDITLSDLAADVRAATPTDAARRLVPDKREMFARVARLRDAMFSSIDNMVVSDRALLDRYYHGLELRISNMRHNNAELINKGSSLIEQIVKSNKIRVRHVSRLLAGLDPDAILSRGYSIARVNGRVLKSNRDFQPRDIVMLQLHQGEVSLRANNDKDFNEQEQTTIQL